MDGALVYQWLGTCAGDRPGGSVWALRRYYGALTAAGRCERVELFAPVVGGSVEAHLLVVRADSARLTAIVAEAQATRLHRDAAEKLAGFCWSVHTVE